MLTDYFRNKLAQALLSNVQHLNAPSAPIELSIPRSGEMTIYVHFPFCDTVCRYCPFSKTINKKKMEQYCEALLREIDLLVDQQDLNGRTVSSIYFGGGTPSLIPAAHLERILEKLQNLFHLPDGTQITLESNPSSIRAADLGSLMKMGVNRLSIGVQSFDGEVLEEMGRRQDPEGTRRLLSGFKEHGFSRFNVDLMYGFQCQSSEMFLQDISAAADFGADHLSIFPLTWPRSDKHSKAERLELEKRQQRMYEQACALATELGFSQYSIEDFSRSADGRNHYQLDCWQVPAKGMLILGTSAFGGIAESFYFKEPDIRSYLEAVARDELPIARITRTEGKEFLARKLMLGLHFLTVDQAVFEEAYGPGAMGSASKMTLLLRGLGLLSKDKQRLALTEEGRFFYTKLWTSLMQYQYSNL